MNCQIRIAVPADEQRIDALFREMLKTIDPAQDAKGYEEGYLVKFWGGGESRIYVAEDEKVRAFLSVEVYREPEAYMYLDDFSVTETYRNRGIGTNLMLKAEAYAKEIGLPAILLHVEKSNEAAFRFYERQGYSVYREDGSRYLLIKIITRK